MSFLEFFIKLVKNLHLTAANTVLDREKDTEHVIRKTVLPMTTTEPNNAKSTIT